MALSDCPKCWETPCGCGYEYREWSNERLSEHIAALMTYKSWKDSIEIILKVKIMILKPKTSTAEAIYYDGNTLSEWPTWIKDAFIKGLLHVIAAEGIKKLWLKADSEGHYIEVVTGYWLLWDGSCISIQSTESLEKLYENNFAIVMDTPIMRRIPSDKDDYFGY